MSCTTAETTLQTYSKLCPLFRGCEAYGGRCGRSIKTKATVLVPVRKHLFVVFRHVLYGGMMVVAITKTSSYLQLRPRQHQTKGTWTQRNNSRLPRSLTLNPDRTNIRASVPTPTLVRNFMSALRLLSLRKLSKLPARISLRHLATEHALQHNLKPTRYGQPLFASHPHLSKHRSSRPCT